MEDHYINKFDFFIHRYFLYEMNIKINATDGANRIVGTSIETIGDYDFFGRNISEELNVSVGILFNLDLEHKYSLPKKERSNF